MRVVARWWTSKELGVVSGRETRTPDEVDKKKEGAYCSGIILLDRGFRPPSLRGPKKRGPYSLMLVNFFGRGGGDFSSCIYVWVDEKASCKHWARVGTDGLPSGVKLGGWHNREDGRTVFKYPRDNLIRGTKNEDNLPRWDRALR